MLGAICAWGDAEMLIVKFAACAEAGASHTVLFPCNPGEDYRPNSVVSKEWNWKLLNGLCVWLGMALEM